MITQNQAHKKKLDLLSMNEARFSKEPSSQLQPSQSASSTNELSIQSLEISVQNLIRSWNRRQKWQNLFNYGEQYLNNSPWRTCLTNFLESMPARVIVVLLILLDLVLTVLELSSSRSNCPPNKYSVEETWHHWVGISILSLLAARSVALAIGLGRSFFKKPGYMIDGAVVIGALILEAILERKGGGLLILASFWRVVKLIESSLELGVEDIEAQIQAIISQVESVGEENKGLSNAIVEKDMMIHELQENLERKS